jgi:hypothetical protein
MMKANKMQHINKTKRREAAGLVVGGIQRKLGEDQLGSPTRPIIQLETEYADTL